ncbi:hypothetical protein BJV82DRAFT_520091 [Fennellomyces sp. T-0311]|nr:hypothetical protein BJV82DRAFT_520091 [Fennellomyces sp. T-0311]
MESEFCAVLHSATILTADATPELKYEPQRFLLLGLRQGTILSFRMAVEGDQRLLYDVPPAVLRLGTCAVQFDKGSATSDSILALSDRLWRIRYSNICPQLLEIEPVLLPNFSSSVESMVSFTLDRDNTIQALGVVADGFFHILKLSSKCTIGTRKISIGETPSKILYDKASNCAFVVTTALKDSSVKSTLRLVDLSRCVYYVLLVIIGRLTSFYVLLVAAQRQEIK